MDSNVPIYMVGADHPNKSKALRAVEQLASARQRLVTDAEVFQEILHRYRAINRRQAMEDAFDTLVRLVDEIFPVAFEDVDRARALIAAHERLSSRDAIHVAVMERREVAKILSYDEDFDLVPGIERIT